MNCSLCKGTGELKDAVQAWDEPDAPIPPCHACGGTGKTHTLKSIAAALAALGYGLRRNDAHYLTRQKVPYHVYPMTAGSHSYFNTLAEVARYIAQVQRNRE